VLKISVIVGDITMPLPSIKPGEMGGSITDYTGGTRIIHFSHDTPDTAEVQTSEVGVSIEAGDLRMTLPVQGLTLIKQLHKGESFSFPFRSKYGISSLELHLL
jgi:hypothetical protein